MNMIPLKFAALLCLFALVGCGERSEIVVVPPLDGATVHQVLFATNRAANGRLFGAARSSETTYGIVNVSVPPEHEVGVVEYPGHSAKGQASFGIVDAATTKDPTAFEQLLQQQVALRPKGRRRAVVFVHGYNNTFAEALYMNTQIIHDYKSQDIPILFSWPSAGENLGYLQDRDSVMFSRSALETVLEQIDGSGIESFVIVAHSIGSQLVMEALRQHAIRNKGTQWPKLDGVVLVSPDIDIEMFEQQRADMGGLPKPFVVIGSGNDRLLALSGVINGNSVRLGMVEDASILANADATVVSSSFATHLFSANHTTAFASPEMIALLKGFDVVDAE
jgi:esterase/lipase superfamily enzyme